MTDAGAGERGQKPRFPKSLGDLTDAGKCPSCFEAYGAPSPTCQHCGFTRAPEVLAQLLRLGAEAREPLLRRGQFIVAAQEEARAAAQEEERARISARERAAALEADHARLLGGAAGAFGTPARTEQVSMPPAQRTEPVAVSQQRVAAAAPQAGFAHQHGQRPLPPQPNQTALGAGTRQGSEPPQARQPRRSSVQLLLLVLGIGLLSIAAILFLTFAWVVFGVEVKATITAGVTLGVIATASVLKRRGLTATAEGIAALGIVLVLLDVWAIQATGLFGANLLPGTLYWGLGLLVATAAFEGWHRVSRLRAPGIAASITLLPAIALTVAGATAQLLLPLQRLVLSLVLAGAAAAAHVVLHTPHADVTVPSNALTAPEPGSFSAAPARSLERWILAVTGAFALLAALVAGTIAAADAESWLGYTVLLIIAAAAAAAHAWLVSRERGALGGRTLLITFGALTALALGAAPLGFTGATRLALSLALIPIALAAAQLAAARLTAQRDRLSLAVTALSLTTIATSSLPLATLVLGVLPSGYASALLRADQAQMAEAFSGASTGTWWAIASGAVGLALGAALLRRSPGLAGRFSPVLAAGLSLFALCAAMSAPGALPVTLASLVVAAAGATSAILLARGPSTSSSSSLALRVVLQLATALAIVTLLASGLASRPLEIVALVAGAALTFSLRFASSAAAIGLRSTLTALTALQLLAGPLLVAHVRDAWNSAGSLGTSVAVTTSYLIIAALLAAATLLPRPWLSRPERALLGFAAALPGLAASFTLLALVRSHADRAGRTELLTSAVWPLGALWPIAAGAALLLVIVIAAVGLRRRDDDDALSVTPLLAVTAPVAWAALAGFATTFVTALQLPAVAAALGVAAGALVAGGMLVARLRGRPANRALAPEIGAGAVTFLALVGTSTLVDALGRPTGAQFLAGTIAVSAVVPILLATTPHGLFRARGRAFLAWVSVALLTTAWYVFAFATPTITGVEQLHLPAGVPLVVAGTLLWWFGAARAEARPARAAALALAGGLAVSLLVPALDSSSTLARTVIYFSSGAAVALGVAAAKSSRSPVHARPMLVALSATGGAVAVLAALARVLHTEQVLPALLPNVEALLWLTAMVVLVAATAWLLLRTGWSADQRSDTSRRALLISVLGALAVALAAAFARSTSSDDASLLVGIAALAALLAAVPPARLASGHGRACVWAVALVALVPVAPDLARWAPAASPAAGAAPWLTESLLLIVLAASVTGVARVLHEASFLTRLPNYLAGILASWLLVHHLQLTGIETGASVLAAQLAGTAGALALLTALLGVLISPGDTRRGDGTALRSIALVVGFLGIPLAPAAAAAATAGGLVSWSPLPLATGLLAATAVVCSIHLERPGRLALLRYLGVPALALSWVWEVLDNWEEGSIFLAFGGAFLVLFAAGAATTASARGRARGDNERASIEGLLWLAAAPAIWLTAGAIAAIARTDHVGELRVLALSVPEFALSLTVLALVAACTVVPVPAWLRAPANALGVGAAVSGAVLGPALVLSVPDQTPLGVLAIWGVLPAALVLLFASALWRRQQQLQNPVLASLSASVLVLMTTFALVVSGVAGVVRNQGSNTELLALTWVVALCALALLALLHPSALPNLLPRQQSAAPVPGAQPSLRLPGIAFTAGAFVALVGVLQSQEPMRGIELATAPLAATLLAAGLLLLDRRPALRSWPALWPGLLLLLLPSYLAQFPDPALWRVITLGLVAVAVTLWGALRKLQAPLVLGAVVTVLHAATAFRQQLAAVAGVIPWWAWLALAGTVLVVVATTYEARLRDARRATASIRSLR